MNYQAIRLLQPGEVNRAVSELAQRTFVDGKATAGGKARDVKHNLQVERTSPETSDLDRMVLQAYRQSPEFQTFAIPKRLLLPIYSRYEPGMAYGAHIDNALMSEIRTDLATTLFLSRPDTYDGGELVIETPVGEERIKLDAGEAIVYAASTVHYVAPVTRGVRLAAVTWIQSVIRDERIRAILFDLSVCSQLPATAEDAKLSLLLTKSYHNLLRYAAEI
jgi:PKHD-type hydroxylase